ncbi:MAG TPA: AMP-binding protein, partial [Methylomirabilota bacterium]
MAELSVSAFTVYDLITRGAAVHRDAPAVIQGERVVCFRELRERVDALAAGLAGLGIGAGERVCVLAQNDAAYLELYGACARQGIVAYPINWRLTGAEVERVVDRARPRMMVIDQSTRPLVADWLSGKDVPHRYRLTGPAGDDFGALADLYGSAAAPEPVDVAPTEAFAVISTAAVDVVPRGAVLTHANVITANLTAIGALGLTERDRYLAALPLFHITALGMSLAHLHAGGAVVIVPRYDAEEAVRLIDRHRITHVSDFPPVLASLLDAAEKAGSVLSSLLHVSGLDAPATIQRLHGKTRAKFWT